MLMLSQRSSFPIWHLRSGSDRRFRSGHPWVYSNELRESPKGIKLGEVVELRDAGGVFLARGIGNPHSLIAFRALSRDSSVSQPLSVENVVGALVKALRLRTNLGFSSYSHRLCYGEVDGLPGLVIDRYVLCGRAGQVFVVQAHTAGMDVLMPEIEQILEQFVRSNEIHNNWDRTGIVIRNDLGVRSLEGLESQEPRILKEISGVDLRQAMIEVRPVLGAEPLKFHVDLVEGQKTGFFLDQFANIQIAALRFRDLVGAGSKKVVRILDLCCYAGQWGAQLAQVFRDQGVPIQVVLADASAKALEQAKKNIGTGATIETLKIDVLKDLTALPSQSFDIVISDPPALIKSRKDIPTGKQAYVKLTTQALRLVKPEGGVVICSCSALLDEEMFSQILCKSSSKAGVTTQWIARGVQSPDHPILQEFPEGKYLKCWVGVVRK